MAAVCTPLATCGRQTFTVTPLPRLFPLQIGADGSSSAVRQALAEQYPGQYHTQVGADVTGSNQALLFALGGGGPVW